MNRILITIGIFALSCAMPFIGLYLTKLAYADFSANADFAWGIFGCMFIGVIACIIYLDFSQKDNK
jgi:hypothetical protein